MRLSIFILALFIAAEIFAQIRVSNNNRTLETVTGEPFFWLGDTDWELVHRLTREEILEVLEVRKQQGFNVLQVVALAEMDGIRQPNRYGDWPLNNEDLSSYSSHLEKIQPMHTNMIIGIILTFLSIRRLP